MAEENGLTPEETQDHSNLLNGIHYTGNKGPCFGTRHTQFVLMTIGMGMALVTQTSFAIIIVAMTEQQSSNPDVPIFEWKNQGVLLGAVLWSGIPTQVLGGYLGGIWGHKWLVLGLSLMNAVFFMLVPLSANMWDSTGVVVCRFMQGAAQGALAPMRAVLSGHWIPAEEWSIIGVITIGASVIMSLSATVSVGFICSSWLGWAWCFYIFGIIELVWCGFWLVFAHQTPHVHPKITPEEKMYIQVSLKQQDHDKKVTKTPWKKILTSMPFYAIVIATIGTEWSNTIQGTVMPTFLSKVLGIDVKKIALISIGPILGVSVGFVAAKSSDFIIRKNIMRRVNARKLFHTIGSFGVGLNIIWITFIKPGNIFLIVLNLCIGNMFLVFYSVSGAGVNVFDISPVFAGLISGIANTCSHAVSLFAPLSVDWIVKDESSAAEWRIIMLITALFAILSGTFFDIFASDQRQEDWEESSNETNNKNKNCDKI